MAHASVIVIRAVEYTLKQGGFTFLRTNLIEFYHTEYYLRYHFSFKLDKRAKTDEMNNPAYYNTFPGELFIWILKTYIQI